MENSATPGGIGLTGAGAEGSIEKDNAKIWSGPFEIVPASFEGEDMELGLKGKIALVTGAGSQIGFGKAICLALAREGCDIVAADVNLEGAGKTAADVEALGRKALAVKADITKKAEVRQMVGEALATFGRIDILVNNAGAVLGMGPFIEQDEALWDRELALNLKGPMLVSQAVLPGMIERRYGKIINVSSDTAKMTWPMVSMYNIAKAAIYKFTRELARTVIEHNVFVNSVSPGWSLDTDFAKGDKEAMKPRFLAETPVGRGTSPQDIAAAVCFFASDISSDIVGQILSLSGGSTFQ
jgi:2-hydroxycyclohexanecarboxyl-CoA dehydrogenase